MPVVTDAEMVRASGINPKANISKKSFYQSVKKGLCLVVTQPLGILFWLENVVATSVCILNFTDEF